MFSQPSLSLDRGWRGEYLSLGSVELQLVLSLSLSLALSLSLSLSLPPSLSPYCMVKMCPH